MKIKKLILENVKCFKEYSLDFTTNNDTLNHIVLVGRNGSGKSTILKSIVEVLLKLYSWSDKEPLLKEEENYFTDKDIFFNEKYLSICLDFELDEFESQQLARKNFMVELLHWEKSQNEESGFIVPRLCSYKDEYINLFYLFVRIITKGKALYFDAFRYMSNENPLGPNLQESKKIYFSLLQSNIDIYGKSTRRDIDLKQWIINTDYLRLKNTSDRYELLYNHLVKAFDMLLHPLKFERISEEGEIIFYDNVNDQPIGVSLLSDGFKSIFQIIIATMRMLFESSKENDLFYLNSAIVIVDEIDCHIHPRWQKSIMPSLTELFPNCQFIVTTHSPYIIESVQDCEVIRIGDKPII